MNTVYWTDAVSRQVMRVNAAGGSPTALTEPMKVGVPTGIAIDDDASTLYYAVYGVGGRDEIRKVNTDGTGDQRVAQLRHEHPLGMALGNGRLYYVAPNLNAVRSVSTGGAGPRTDWRFRHPGAHVRGVAYYSGTLYWTDVFDENLKSYEGRAGLVDSMRPSIHSVLRVDGSDRQRDLYSTMRRPVDVSIDSAANTLYFADARQSGIVKYDRATQAETTLAKAYSPTFIETGT